MKSLRTLLLISTLGVASCLGENAGDEATVDMAQLRVFPGDDEIIAKVYDNAYQVPDYFHVDDRASTPESYTLYHVKDLSVSYELCTNDYHQALAWEAADNDRRAVQDEFVGSYENEKYFEFIRELAYPDGVGNIADPTSPGFARVFKCEYVDRTGADRNLRNGYAGTLMTRPLSNDAINTYAEYMWQFTFFWPATKKVLETFSEELDNTYQHTLLLAFLTNQGSGRCDLIEVVDWVFSIDKSNGEITKTFIHLYQFEAQWVNAGPQKCNA